MKVPLRWLYEYLDRQPDSERLAQALTHGGLEVEGIERPYIALKQIVVGRISEISPHPDAEKLKVCLVETGNRNYRVVCGAPNAAVGLVVPLALPGAMLHKSDGEGAFEVQSATIRGIFSEGVLCSGLELGISKDHTGLLTLSESIPSGISVAAALGLDDDILCINVTANRPDCLSLIGVAREVSALLDCRLQLPMFALQEKDTQAIFHRTGVSVQDAELCPRYAARLIEDVEIKPSPDWLVKRLQACGIRSINNVVDATNYVLLECGQPLHAFDFDRLEGRKIVVRRAKPNEEIVTLDNITRKLSSDTLLICDTEHPVAIAGVMGGKHTEVTEKTKNLFLESACFNPVSIRKTSKALNLKTEAAYHFERQVDPEGVITALDRVAALILDLAGGRLVQGRIDIKEASLTQPKTVTVRPKRIEKLLGLDITWETMREKLTRIGIQTLSESPLGHTLLIPSYRRSDLYREVDIAEEVARLVGLDQIPVSYPKIEMSAYSEPKIKSVEKLIRSALQGNGLSEVITLSFSSPDVPDRMGLLSDDPRRKTVKVQNPLSPEGAALRSMLFPNLLSILKFNLDRRILDLGIFECGVVHQDTGTQLSQERYHVAGLLSGHLDSPLWRSGHDKPLFFCLKGCVENLFDTLTQTQPQCLPATDIPYLHPGRACRIVLGGVCAGEMGEIHPALQSRLELSQPVAIFELDVASIPMMASIKAKTIARYPSIERDMALIVDRVICADQIIQAIWKDRPSLLEEVVLFDQYEGTQIQEGKKSLAFRLRYQSYERSITGEEVGTIHHNIIRLLEKEIGAKLRV